MKDEEKLKGIREALRSIIEYPGKGKYPREICYDRYAYERIVRSYRNGLRKVLRQFK